MNLFQFGWFASHSGFQLPWKIDCDALTDGDLEAIARIIQWKFAFSEVHGVPRGGLRLADACRPHADPDSEYPILIVDDVLTTGRSMTEFRSKLEECGAANFIGVTIVARCPKDGANVSVPSWVFPILNVNEWSQSRATGLG